MILINIMEEYLNLNINIIKINTQIHKYTNYNIKIIYLYII